MRRSQRVFEPTTLPLCATFEDAGMVGTMARLRAELATDCGDVFVALLPAWIWSLDFHQAVVECARCGNVADIVASLRAHSHRFRRVADAPPPGAHQRPVQSLTASQQAATVRLAFGELLEAHAAQRASLVCGASELPVEHADRKALARVYFDSYLASVWTSAHAEYLGTIQDLAGNRPLTESIVRDMMVPVPEIYSVLNLSNLLDLSALYERALSPRCCAKSSQPLLAILSRATNAGSRGWESTLHTAVKDSDGAVRACMNALGVAFAGLHPCIHPAARPDWHARFVVLRAWRAQNQTAEFKELVKKAPGAIKEAVRLHLAGTLSADCATLGAFLQTQQPSGQLVIPPQCLPPGSMIAAMHSFVAAAAEMAAPGASEDAASLINRHLNSEPRSRKKPKAAAARLVRSSRSMRASKAGGACQSVETIAYYASWLGGRAGPTSASVRPATAVISGLLSGSFRAKFVPFWLHAQLHGQRAARLDAIQYRALHHNSPAYKLLSLLPIETFRRVQRLVMTTNSASLLTVAQACALLGIPMGGAGEKAATSVPSGATSRVTQEAEAVFMGLNATDAATLAVFARMCSLRSQMLAYDLGDRTRRMQAEAVCKRLLVAPRDGETAEQTALERLPKHATHLYACSECKRVVNACQEFQGKDQPFNELGLAASMLEITGDVRCGHMRCAKRSSAALRTAVALEAAAEALEVEKREMVAEPLLPPDLRPASVVATMCDTRKKPAAPPRARAPVEDEDENEECEECEDRESSSEVAKFRRDVKNCFEQHERAVSCGDVPLVCIPILGRAVRIFGDWLGICSFCGCLAKILPTSRFRGDLCCMRCDFSMLVGKESAAVMDAALPKEPLPACRFCGKVQPANCTGAKWRKVDAPLDSNGSNASVPAPLRVVHYCPSHYRGWLLTAHQSLDTCTIFSHLVAKARPMHGADAAAKTSGGGGGSSNGGGGNGDAAAGGTSAGDGGAPAPKPSTASKRKTALTKRIAKNNRQDRLASRVRR